LGLNKLSNDFGRNWFRGLFFTIASGLILFIILLLTIKEFHLVLLPPYNGHWIEPFLKFMNPLRHFDTDDLFSSDKKLHLNSFSYAIDFTARIVVAYGVYQTIQAFRRFGKK
jgi:hypothetical protein